MAHPAGMAGKLDGKVALVSGAARGIGHAIAALFVAEGARVLLADLSGTTEAAGALGEGAAGVTLDVREPAGWAAAVGEAERLFGRLDVLVNNAGVMMYGGLTDFSEDQVRLIIDVNLTGTIFGTQAAIPAMLRAGGGAIVNISSLDGLIAHNGLSIYAASKWGVRGYTKACALELSHQGIRVNSIHPGGVLTPMANPQQLSREAFGRANMMTYPTQVPAMPEDVARAALFLAGPDGGYCAGAELAVDGGMAAGQYLWFLPGTPPGATPPGAGPAAPATRSPEAAFDREAVMP